MKLAARRFHRRFWIVFGLLLPVAFLSILFMKQEKPVDAPSILLEAPR